MAHSSQWSSMGVLENPLNLLLIPPILYLLYVMILPPHPEVLKTVPRTYDAETYNWLPAKHPDVILYRNYTAGELAKYDGKDDGKILLAIMNVGRAGKIPEGGKCERTVFDVTRGSNFYGPGESCVPLRLSLNALHRMCS